MAKEQHIVAGGHRLFGLWLGQHPNTSLIINRFLQESNPKIIIEIGTASGGLSVLLQIYAILNNIKFVTYDICNNSASNPLFNILKIDYRIKDALQEDSANEIGSLMQSASPSVLFCDNGNKIKEFNTFIPFMKPGDFILAHDYAPTLEYLAKYMLNRIWDCVEITDKDVSKVSSMHGLEHFMQKELLSVAWLCKKKTK